MKSMKMSNRRILPLVFLPFLFASCTKTPQPISYGHDLCSLCENTIENEAFAALALSHDGIQYNYDSIECMVQHLGQHDSEMAVIKVADYQHPGFMLNAQQSHYKINDNSSVLKENHLAALRHSRANTLCWKELKEMHQHSEYISQNTTIKETGIQEEEAKF